MNVAISHSQRFFVIYSFETYKLFPHGIVPVTVTDGFTPDKVALTH
jgi:hypothetical protein